MIKAKTIAEGILRTARLWKGSIASGTVRETIDRLRRDRKLSLSEDWKRIAQGLDVSQKENL